MHLCSFCSCFISDIRVLYGLFLAPLLAVLLFNTVVFVMVTVVLIKHTRKKLSKDGTNKTQGTIKAIISVFSVMLMFGLSWLFGALSIDRASIFFQWLFLIFNTLQGFFLFIFFCVLGSDAREEWLNLLSCYRRKKKHTHSVITHSRGSHAPKSSTTKRTDLSSRTIPQHTIKKNLGLISESSQLESSVYESKVPIDHTMSVYNHDDLQSLKSNAQETNFVITNDSTVEETKVDLSLKTPPEKIRRKKTSSQLPPHIQFKLKRPYYHVVLDPEESAPASSSVHYGQEYTQELTQTTDDLQFSQDHSQELTQTSDLNVFSNLTDDSTMALIDSYV